MGIAPVNPVKRQRLRNEGNRPASRYSNPQIPIRYGRQPLIKAAQLINTVPLNNRGQDGNRIVSQKIGKRPILAKRLAQQIAFLYFAFGVNYIRLRIDDRRVGKLIKDRHLALELLR
jgi:hypothetical protein